MLFLKSKFPYRKTINYKKYLRESIETGATFYTPNSITPNTPTTCTVCIFFVLEQIYFPFASQDVNTLVFSCS